MATTSVSVELKLKRRSWPVSSRHNSWRDKPTGKSIVYLSFEKETVLDNFVNRTSRPHQELKPLIVEQLTNLGINCAGIRWSQKAGCSMCPCSPGFILPNHIGYDIWATISGVKPRTDDEEAHNRAAQLLSDPTMPPLGANTL